MDAVLNDDNCVCVRNAGLIPVTSDHGRQLTYNNNETGLSFRRPCLTTLNVKHPSALQSISLLQFSV